MSYDKDLHKDSLGALLLQQQLPDAGEYSGLFVAQAFAVVTGRLGVKLRW